MRRDRKEALSDSMGERLSRYLRVLETLLESGRSSVRSRELGEALVLGADQVRKDLSKLGQFGQRGVGYDVGLLVAAVRAALGTDRRRRVAVIGAGRLGQALALHRGFRPRGFDIEAIFDTRADLIETTLGGMVVADMASLPVEAARLSLEIALLAVPADVAQEALDACAAAGIRGVVSFAEAHLRAPKGVVLRQADLSRELERLIVEMEGVGERGSGRASEDVPPFASPPGSVTI